MAKVETLRKNVLIFFEKKHSIIKVTYKSAIYGTTYF
jgi:hypothetical protein